MAREHLQPDKKVVKTDAEVKIFQGQIAKPSSCTRNCPLGMVMYFGKSIVLSEPKGIMLAAIYKTLAQCDFA